MLRREIGTLLKPEAKTLFKKIYFDSSKSIIHVDKRQIQIPFSSNQYYLCQAVFSNPKRRWETDELLERFGENSMSGKTRKIYDAMLAVNKRVGYEIIRYQDKVYSFSPDLINKIK